MLHVQWPRAATGRRAALLLASLAELLPVASFVAALLLVGAAGSPVRADDSSKAAPASPKPLTHDELVKKREQTAQRIAALTQEKNPPSAKPTGEAERPRDQEVDLLESLDLVYVQHLAALDELDEVQQKTRRLGEERNSLHSLGPAEPKPYSYLLWDEIRDQLDTKRSRAQAIQADSTADRLLQTAREESTRAERDRELLTDSATEHHAAPPAGELRLAALRCEVADATVSLRRAEAGLHAAKLDRSKLNCDYLQDKCDLIGKQCAFTKHDYDSRVAAMDKIEADLKTKLHETQQQLQQQERDQTATLARLHKENADQSVLDAAADAYHFALRGRRDDLILLNQTLGEFAHYKRLLSCRFDFFNHMLKADELAQSRAEVDAILDRQKMLQRACVQRIDDIQTDQSSLVRRLREIEEKSPLRPWLTMQHSEFESLTRHFETTLVQSRTVERSLRRFLSDTAPDAAESGRERLAAAWRLVLAAWNWKLETVDNEPVTIGKIVGGVLYLIVGLFAARVISRVLGRRVLTHFGFNEGARNAIQSIAYYVLCLLCSLMALDLVNLPFAAFTFLGGAVAIGIGFGSQNILNNFISGLILLAEQPLRVGDCVSIDGAEGTVEHIGARSTRVRTMSNHEIMVPNSKLLEDKVTNLTLTNNLVQTSIGVTVSPSLSVAEVRRRLLAAATGHRRVLRNPAPIVLFLSFGSAEMSFELRFWVCLNSLQECRLTESDVRESISDLLREANPSTTAAKGAIEPPKAAAPDATAQPDPKQAIVAALASASSANRSAAGDSPRAPLRKAG